MKRNDESLSPAFSIDGRQEELLSILERQVRLYTMGDSDSLPVELAQSLLSSVGFCIQVHLAEGGGQAEHCPLFDLFRQGQRDVWRLTEEAKLLLHRVAHTAGDYGSLAFRDTLEALGDFFRLYDMRFFAHDIPCMIDYPLCLPVSNQRLGVLFIGDYLERLLLESRFCRCFDQEAVQRLLLAFHPEYRVLVVNLFEPVLTTALGLILLDRDPAALDLDRGDCHRLYDRFHPWREEPARLLVRKAAGTLCAVLGLWDTDLRLYVRESADTRIPLLRSASREGFSNLFSCR